MKRKFTLLAAALMLLSCLAVPMGMRGQTRTETTTYTFTSKSWAATPNNWTSGKDGNQFQNDRGVQVTTGATGANATSPSSFENVSQVIVTYSTNASSGAGSIAVQIGSNTAVTKDVTKTGGTTDRTLEFNFNTYQTGSVKFTVTCTTNSIYVKSIAITTTSSGGSSVTAPTISPASCTFETSQSVTITPADGTTMYYTINGDDPDNSLQGYTTAQTFSVTETTTVNAIAYNGNDHSSIVSATYTKLSYDNIEDITESGANYMVKGTVVAVSARAFVLGDGTGYVYYYNGYTAPSVSVGEKKIVSGTTSNYGHIIQFPNSAQISATETSNYDETPTATIITAIPTSYSEGLHLSDYFQFEGTLTKTSGYYYVAVGEEQINIAYPSSAQQNAMNALENKNVRVKGYFAGINSSNYFSVLLESIVENVGPSLAIDPATANPFTYVFGTVPNDYQVFEVTGDNLTSTDIVATISDGASYFEVSDDDENYSNTVTIASGDLITIRMKAGLEKGSYSGKLTLSSTGATNVEVSLSGTVTGQTFTINTTDEISNGTVTCSPASPVEEGTAVTLSAVAATGYDFVADSWVIYDTDLNETGITVTNNQFTMPTYDVIVYAEFTAKPTYGITCAVTPANAAEMEASPATAYAGQTITVSYVPETGYTLTSIAITKTSDGTATDITPTTSGDDYTFTMPDYAVTVTATFLSNTFEGNFVLFTGEMTEGDYILVYDGEAMTNTVTSNKFDVTSVNPSGDIIANPSRDIVWHIAPSSPTGYWTIKNEKVNKYANCSTGDKTNVTLVDTPYDGAKWIASGTDTHEFRPKNNENNSTRYLRKDSRFGTYTTSYGGSLTLYKYTVFTPVTITFNGNGGTYNEATTYIQEVYSGIEATLNANQFVNSGYGFAGWNTEQNGNGTSYTDGGNITVTDNTTLYAQWDTQYTATVANDIVGGTVKIIVGSEQLNSYATVAGAEITLSATPSVSHRFSAWNVKDSDNVTVTVTDNKFTMPAKNVTISATFEEVTTYSLVQSQAQLIPGKHYIIVGSNAAGTDYYAMGAQTSNYRSIVSVTKTGNTIQEADGVCEFVISGDATSGWTFYDISSNLYLKAVNGNELAQSTLLTTDVYNYWTIDFSVADAKEFIKSNKYTDRFINFNLGNTRFANYKTTSNMQPVKLYVKDGDTDLMLYSGTTLATEVSCTSCTFGTNGKLTIANNGILNCSGAITGATASNLIIKDGGQLKVYATGAKDGGVQATVEKNISAWTTGTPVGGWYFIASPIDANDLDPVVVDNLTTDDDDDNNHTFDLYKYVADNVVNEEPKPWYNYRAHSDVFVLANGQGYLYANAYDQTLAFAGAVKPYSEENNANQVAVNAGWNLIGNPYTFNTYVNQSYYKLNGDRTAIEAMDDNAAIAPCTGIIVKAETSGNVTFSETNSGGSKGGVDIMLSKAGTRSNATLDNAIVSFNEGSQLEKFYFMQQNANLYIPQGAEEYAIVNAEAQGEMPVSFRANENGQYTLTVNPEGVEMNYLHLIDNMTGADVDLLATPSYTFNAKKNDLENRFKLVFAANNGASTGSAADQTFAFFSNGNLIINNAGEATLQVIDITGRVLSSETINGGVSIGTSGLTAGVYVLRLVNGKDVKTQKIVVE